MRIVTLNTWKNEGDYARRLALMAEGLAPLQADVICLQECFCGGGADTAAFLAARLGLRVHAAPARRKFRPHGGRQVMSASGLAILSRHGGRAEIRGLASDPRDGQRIAQRFDLDLGGPPLRILNLHLTHLRGVRADKVRAEQLADALEWAGAGVAGGLVVAGDLNATAADAALAPLGLVPAPATLHGPRAGAQIAPGLAIDHCVLLRSGGWRPAATHRALDAPDAEEWFPSDHAAVVLDLIPKDQAAY